MKYYYKKEIKNKSEWEAAFRAAYGNKKDAPWEVGYSGERLADDLDSYMIRDTLWHLVRELELLTKFKKTAEFINFSI